MSGPDQMETILIIEDDPAMLRGLKDNFEFKGYKVLTAADGEKALIQPTIDYPSGPQNYIRS